MILQALYDYYERKAKLGKIAPVGWIKKEISYIIEINENGDCVDITSLIEFDEQSNKFCGKPLIVPCIGKQALKHTNNGIDANFLWDNTAFVLGRYPENSNNRTIKKKTGSRESFYELTKQFNEKTNIQEISAVLEFLKKLRNGDTNQSIMNFITEKLTNNEISTLTHQIEKIQETIKQLKSQGEKQTLTEHKKVEKRLTKELTARKKAFEGFLNGGSNPAVSFRIYGQPKIIFELSNVKESYSTFFFPEQHNEDNKRRCLITGELEVIEPKHLVIKGVIGAQSSGSAIISFNNEALCSYGFAKKGREGLNAAVGKEAAEKYVKAINTLLSSDTNNVTVGGTSFIFWTEKDTALNIEKIAKPILSPPRDNPDACTSAVKELYESIYSGKIVQDESKRFYILGLSAPSKARITIRHWQNGTVGEFAKSIQQHFNDLEIKNNSPEPKYDSLSAILAASAPIAGKKIKAHHIWYNKMRYDVPPNLAENVITTILQNRPYPQTLLHSVIKRIRAEQNKKIKDRPVPNVTRIRAAIIKACINKFNRVHNKKEEGIKVSLDKTNENPAYLLGRLFAVLERVQERAFWDDKKNRCTLNSTIRNRYYSSLSSAPVTVFPQLMRLKEHHLEKFPSTGKKVAEKKAYENKIGEIIDLLDGTGKIPRQLNLEQQGRFAVGYYHQRQDLKFKEEKNNNTLENAEEKTNE